MLQEHSAKEAQLMSQLLQDSATDCSSDFLYLDPDTGDISMFVSMDADHFRSATAQDVAKSIHPNYVEWEDDSYVRSDEYQFSKAELSDSDSLSFLRQRLV